MDMAPAGGDVAEQRAGPDALVLADRGEDVPVGERMTIGLLDGDRVRVEMDGSGRDGIDGGAVRRGDVHAEMERVLGGAVETAALARVVEGAADRMRPVERLDRPAVRLRAGGSEQRRDACRSPRNASTHPVGTRLSLRVFSSD